MDGDREGEAEEAGAAPGAGEGAARPGAGWAHVALGFDDRGKRVWTCSFCSKVSPGENHTRVRLNSADIPSIIQS
jgi:hypothetical protein